MDLRKQFGQYIDQGHTLLVRDGSYIVRKDPLQVELAKRQGYTEAALPVESLGEEQEEGEATGQQSTDGASSQPSDAGKDPEGADATEDKASDEGASSDGDGDEPSQETVRPLTENQQEQYEEFEARARGEGNPLTPRQQGILEDLRQRREAYLNSIA